MFALAFTGFARSGKDTAADCLVEKYGFKKIVMSDVPAELLKKEGLPDTKMNRSRMGKRLRGQFGDDIVARRVFEKAVAGGWEKVVFVGPRSVSEIEFFRKSIPGFLLVAVGADEAKRFLRRSDADGQTKEKFLERDAHDSTAFELQKVIKMADCAVSNNGTLEALQKALGKLMRGLEKA